MFEAAGHFAGALLVWLGIVLAWAKFAERWDARRRRVLLEEAAEALGTPPENLSSQSWQVDLRRFLEERYRADSPGNRLSDRFGLVYSTWFHVGALGQLATLLTTLWLTANSTYDHAAWAWLMPALVATILSVGAGLSLVCTLLTGRHPGEAASARECGPAFLFPDCADR